MSSYANSSNETVLMFQLKGGLYPLTALQLLGTNFTLFEQQLDAKIEQAPKFFYNAPIVIELQKLTQPISVDFKKLIDILLKKKLIPVGVKGGSPEHQTAAALAGLPILQDNTKDSDKNEQKSERSPIADPSFKTAEPDVGEIRGSNTKIITKPVRSGQQIYAQGGDLIVLAPVSHGSELLADGNIHVYGPLRGRALAGVTGNLSTHIFCQSLEAELVSIAGQYKISEDIDQATWRLAVDISLEGGRLHIRPL